MNQQKKLKLIISSLRQKELIKFFELYSQCFLRQSRRNIKKISYNCYQSTIEYHSKITTGYGKSYNEAYACSITSFMQMHLEDQNNYTNLKQCVKKYAQTVNCEPNPIDKIRTQPDTNSDKKSNFISKTMDSSLKPKDNNMMKSVKTIKQEIFESLNQANIQLKKTPSIQTSQLHKNSSSSLLKQTKEGGDDLSIILSKIKELEQKLVEAESQNQILKNQLRDKQKINQKQLKNSQIKLESSKIDKSFQQITLKEREVGRDVSMKFNNTIQPTKQQPKLRSFSLSNSGNCSNFSTKATTKIKIPKLNLEVLPNYHGKSNKSLNQSLLESYQKKSKA